MDLSNLTNPHFAATGHAAPRTPNNAPLRLRKVTLSPAEEYASRPGTAATIPDELAALILCRKAFVEAGAKGVDLNRKELGGRRRFWHPDSIVCNQIGSGEKLRVIAIWNSLDLSVIHLMTAEGRYIETLPSEIQPAMLDNAALSTELAKHRRVHARHAEHLKRLHADDSFAAVESARHNTAEIQRAVTIIPTEDSSGQRDAAPSDVAAAISRDTRETKSRIATAAAHRRDADAVFDRPLPRQTAPAETLISDPFDIS